MNSQLLCTFTSKDDLDLKIKEITDQYKSGGKKFGDINPSEVKAREKIAEKAYDKVFTAGLEFAKKHSKLYGLKFNDKLSVEQIKKRFGKNDPQNISPRFSHH